MKTNRRGFFGALAGIAGGVYTAFQGKEAGTDVKPVDVTTMADKGEYRLINITYTTGNTVTYSCMGSTHENSP